ncbi:hypothetical protein [Hyalangium sp.]|uniref:hypothetical protein n=1 Tax=Hyalangium sp. TaxID=2028555 RepID=UPI002D2882E8|nr:hypothetical protein [Hyalangium sp.]HYH98221.1 hypothetical protein [Hyalangium sp.]
MSLARLVLCLTLLLPSLGFAQTPEEWTPYTPPAEETATPPPLVPAPPLPPPPPPQQAPTVGPPQAPAEAPPEGEIIPRDLTAQRAASDQKALRLIITPWSGVIMGMAGVIVGAIPTAILALPFCVGTDGLTEEPRCAIAISAALSVSYSVGVTMGVTIVGRMMGGQGDGVMTFLGALAGVAVGSGIGVASQSTGGLVLGLTLAPLLFAVTAYELSHVLATQPTGPEVQARSGFRVMPVVGVTPQGGLLGGLAGRF